MSSTMSEKNQLKGKICNRGRLCLPPNFPHPIELSADESTHAILYSIASNLI